MNASRSAGRASRAAPIGVLVGVVATALSLLAPLPAWSQADTAPVEEPAAPAAPAALPDPLEISTRLRAVTDSALLSERQIATLSDVEVLSVELQLARERQEELQQVVLGLGGAEFVRADRVTRVRAQALQEEQRLAALDERISERLAELGRLRGEWIQRRDFWRRWQMALRDDPEFALFQPEIRQAMDRIEEVRRQIANQLPEMLEVQRDIQALRLETMQIVEQTSATLAGRRAALLQQDQAPLVSSTSVERLRTDPLADWNPVTAVRGDGYRTFVRDHAALLFLHVLLVLFLALIARQLRRRSAIAAGWAEVLQHPWSAALFASTALVAQQYAFAPPLVEVVVWAVLAGSGAVLAGLLIASPSLRRMVYCFSAFYPLFLLAESVWLPPILFQATLAVFSAAGLLLFLLLARHSAAAGEPAYVRWVIGFGAAMWAFVLLAEIAGFHRLARWVIHSAVTSALVLFVVGFLVIVARGLIWTLLHVEAEGRFRTLRNVGVPLAERFLTAVQAVFIGGAMLALLNIWELAPSPLEAWTLITGLGFTIAGAEITIGRVLFAAALVYAAVLVSWLVRTFVSTEVVPRWDLDRGVGDSIVSVFHYVVIAIGVLLALGALGVHLQNFAIVAGALSVGIGFGLQNVVNNFVSGIILLFERPVRVGDTVVVGGEWGTIKKIGLRSTLIGTFDQSELIVPNGDLVSEKVTNWTLSNSTARLTINVGVAYGSPVSTVMQILRESATVHEGVLDDPPPQALFVNFGDSALDFELRVWVRELRMRLDAKSMILEELDRRLREAGIEIPFPQRDLHVRSLDPSLVNAVRGESLRAPERRDGAGVDAAGTEAQQHGQQHGM